MGELPGPIPSGKALCTYEPSLHKYRSRGIPLSTNSAKQPIQKDQKHDPQASSSQVNPHIQPGSRPVRPVILIPLIGRRGEEEHHQSPRESPPSGKPHLSKSHVRTRTQKAIHEEVRTLAEYKLDKPIGVLLPCNLTMPVYDRDVRYKLTGGVLREMVLQ